MGPTRTTTSSRWLKPSVIQQVVWVASPLNGTFTIQQFKALVRSMASQLGIRIGPRLDPCVDNALVVCNERGWIQINFETQTFTITDSGTTKFESIQDAIQDKNDPKQIFSAIKRHIGAPKGLTKPQLLSLHQQTARKLDARIRELELLLAARPRETQMAPKTPLRKAMSLPYPTPVSHPSRPRINFENNLATPPSSPTPQRAPSMDIHLESSPAPPSRFATPIAEEVIEVVPTYDQPTPENEGLRKISELESELAQCKASRAKLEERISDMGDEIRVLKELQVKERGQFNEQIERVTKERHEVKVQLDRAEQFVKGFVQGSAQVFNWDARK